MQTCILHWHRSISKSATLEKEHQPKIQLNTLLIYHCTIILLHWNSLLKAWQSLDSVMLYSNVQRTLYTFFTIKTYKIVLYLSTNLEAPVLTSARGKGGEVCFIVSLPIFSTHSPQWSLKLPFNLIPYWIEFCWNKKC